MAKWLNRKVPYVKGRTIRLSLPRRFMGDLLHFSRRVPSVPMERRMDLGALVEARAAAKQRISWCAIFLKAYALVALRRPELRRTYLSFPWGHLYEHPINVASFSLEREYAGEPAVFYARIANPEQCALKTLDALMRAHQEAEVTAVDSYRRALSLSRLPLPVRRLLWWLGLETNGRAKAYFFGTFGISVVAALGAAGLHLLSPLTTTLNYGPFDDEGRIDVRVAYDHRVLDGATVARAMVALEEVLCGDILQELRAGAAREAEAA